MERGIRQKLSDFTRTISLRKGSRALAYLVDERVEAMDKIVLSLNWDCFHKFWGLPDFQREEDVLQLIPHADPVQLLQFWQETGCCWSDFLPWLVWCNGDILAGY